MRGKAQRVACPAQTRLQNSGVTRVSVYCELGIGLSRAGPIPSSQDCGRPPFWKQLNRYISATVRPISAKFGMMVWWYIVTKLSCRDSKC